VFGWAVVFKKTAMSCGLWINCCEKAMGKTENRLVKAVVSYGKLCAVGEILVIPLKVCGTVYIPKYLYKHVSSETKILNFLSFSSRWST
jgi:hypothetical protein